MRFLLGILLGIALGIAIGLIVAPQPGSETRRALQERMQKGQAEPEEPDEA
jgi:gas vesicle protein